ncbi:MAG: type II secretion system F family protein [Thermoanaerobaculia bacterium]
MQFICRIGTPDGRVLEEIFSASDETALRSDLGKRGYHLFEVKRQGLAPKMGVPTLLRGGRRGRIPVQEFLVFNQELAALLRAGLPLLQAIDLMLERMKPGTFRSVLTEVRDKVKSGTDLSEAFAEFGDLFPRLYPSSLKAGEKSGDLELVIRRFIRYMKLVLDARRRVFSALTYPVVLVVLSLVMIAVMTIYVVPRFMGFFSELDAELPMITQIVLGISNFMSANWVLMLIGLIAAAVGLRSWGRTEPGRLALDHVKLRIPFLGSVLHRFALAEFCRSLATLLSGGIPLVPSFEIGIASVGNAYVRSKIAPTIQMVREGKPFFAALETSEIFTDMSIDMIKVGEATGSLDEMLNSVSDFLDEQIETRMQRLLSLIEPIMLVFMGLIIAILLISIYLPMYSMLGSSKL